MGILKIGAAVFVGYSLGGKLGVAAAVAVKPDASPETQLGAAWGGRIATGLLTMVVLNRVL